MLGLGKYLASVPSNPLAELLWCNTQTPESTKPHRNTLKFLEEEGVGRNWYGEYICQLSGFYWSSGCAVYWGNDLHPQEIADVKRSSNICWALIGSSLASD